MATNTPTKELAKRATQVHRYMGKCFELADYDSWHVFHLEYCATMDMLWEKACGKPSSSLDRLM